MRSWRSAALLLSALVVGLSFARLLEIPSRRSWPPELWIASQQRPPGFGLIPAGLEAGGLVALSGLAIQLVRRRLPCRGTLLALTAAGLGLLSWWVLVLPVDARVLRWTPSSYPPDWSEWRGQAEFGHALRSIFLLVELVLLAASSAGEAAVGRAVARPPRPERLAA